MSDTTPPFFQHGVVAPAQAVENTPSARPDSQPFSGKSPRKFRTSTIFTSQGVSSAPHTHPIIHRSVYAGCRSGRWCSLGPRARPTSVCWVGAVMRDGMAPQPAQASGATCDELGAPGLGTWMKLWLAHRSTIRPTKPSRAVTSGPERTIDLLGPDQTRPGPARHPKQLIRPKCQKNLFRTGRWDHVSPPKVCIWP